ncbi:glycosyltransferase family 2 protein [Pseudalkalibacillus sp. SCS-8]|uniref:glycosyltransferase family 2 protein n=1 Tax=Pseudalkalibacillus nanhaiensis TaxID=3115291 RepID=UPI0032DAF4B7
MGAKKKVLIGCPIHQKPEILKLFLKSLQTLYLSELEISYLLIDDNKNKESSDLLLDFKNNNERVEILQSVLVDEYICDDITHRWNEKLIWKVAFFKNWMIEEANNHEVDFLFLLDSDILLHPNTLKHLINCEKDIISEVFWTKWQPESAPQPQVWLIDEYTQWRQERGENLSEEEINDRYQAFMDMLRKPGVYEVGGLGACTLISKKAFSSGVNFDPIYNLSFWGEDRHFCIRAAALGFTLFVDTAYPAFHVYRETDLEEGKHFLKRTNCEEGFPNINLISESEPKITLSMVIKNESGKFLRRVLQEHIHYIDEAVIIDDGSTDDSAEICREVLSDFPVRLIQNSQSKFNKEIDLRKQQWIETIRSEPEWILNLDADEMFEPKFKDEIRPLLRTTPYDVLSFRLFDFWSDTHYREDQYWKAHLGYRPLLIRFNKDFDYKWKEAPVHCGRFPSNIFSLYNGLSDLRLKHLGWMRPEDRLEKYKRYMEADPKGIYGSLEQYLSILDENPHLVKWKEY